MIPDFCPSCDATEKPFRLIQRPTEQEFRGETLRVTSPALQCRHCGFGLLGPGHLDALRVATHDTYRRQHGLLTSGEISARRKAMGLSQKRFAEYLGVGSASIEPIKNKAPRLIQDQGAEILFAATRELLIQLTSRSLHGEFVLPGVGFVDGEPELKVKKRKAVGA